MGVGFEKQELGQNQGFLGGSGIQLGIEDKGFY